MGLIQLETFIHAPIDRCFDLSRSVDLHIQSAEHTTEKAVAGVISGLMKLDDIVTWEARHFCINQRITVKITSFDRPRSFRDSQIKGIFHSFAHDHIFENLNNGTLMKDVFDFRCPFGLLGNLADPLVTSHMKSFLKTRNMVIKHVAETEEWRAILK